MLTDNPTYEVVFDEYGNKIKETDAENKESITEYDVNNRPVETRVLGKDKSTAEILLKTHVYDEKGNLIDEITKDELGNEIITSFDYDSLNQLRKVTFPDLAIEEYKYNKVGQ